MIQANSCSPVLEQSPLVQRAVGEYEYGSNFAVVNLDTEV